MMFSKGGMIKQKMIARVLQHTDKSRKFSDYCVYIYHSIKLYIILHLAGFELVKKVLLVAFGIWLSTF